MGPFSVTWAKSMYNPYFYILCPSYCVLRIYVHAHAFGLEHKDADDHAPKKKTWPVQALALLPDPSARPENLPKERHLGNVPIFDVPG